MFTKLESDLTLIVLIFFTIEIFFLKRFKTYDLKSSIPSLVIMYIRIYFYIIFIEHLQINFITDIYNYLVEQKSTYFKLAYSLPRYNLVLPAFVKEILCFLVADFIYYLIHFLYHRYNFLFQFHFTHHTITHFNLLEGGRGFFKIFIPKEVSLIFIPFFLFGLELEKIFFYSVLIQFYSILLHTEFFKHNKYLELIINTPSMHRTHHSLNNSNKIMMVNLGGFLSVWDHLFGTYHAERKLNGQHIYGIPNFRSDNVIMLLFYGWYSFFKKIIKSRNLNELKAAVF